MKYLSVVLLLFIAGNAGAQGRLENEEIIVDSLNRRFVVYVPRSDNNLQKLPVLISLHGRFGTGAQMMSFADFRPIADKEKFIVVCPDGIDRSWNAGLNTPAHKKGVNDVKFIDQLITYVLNTYHGDAKRVYITGMSNGGFLASRVACEMPNRIAAIAAVGASMDKNMNYLPTRPIPVMYIQGTKDPLVPFDGIAKRNSARRLIYSHADMLKLWIDADGCDEKPAITNLPDNAGDGTTITKEEYTNAKTGVKVIGYTITNAGHTWPGGTQYLPKVMIGSVSHNMNACEVIWAFFKAYKLPD
ncbi:MAG TPA: PHB depolymerase family esterase [Mucilaginibacter sp.]|jgi:polyhydroxybutyrate depolymerase|nr:PHB depolymerase family esterase [Mucilaginibacter sp.]